MRQPLLYARTNYATARADESSRREQQQENSSRLAHQYMTYVTTGVGQVSVGQQMFDTVFYTPPIVTAGSVLLTPPGPGWRYPLSTAGVYRWAINNQGFYVGAYLYFTVDCVPENPDDDVKQQLNPEQLDTILSYYRNLINQANSDRDYAMVRYYETALARRRAQRTLNRKPPTPKVEHHLVFQGTATKQLPSTVTNQL